MSLKRRHLDCVMTITKGSRYKGEIKDTEKERVMKTRGIERDTKRDEREDKRHREGEGEDDDD